MKIRTPEYILSGDLSVNARSGEAAGIRCGFCHLRIAQAGKRIVSVPKHDIVQFRPKA